MVKFYQDARQYITIDQFQSTYTKCIVKCKTKLETIYNGNVRYQHKTPLSSLILQRCEWLLPKDESSITQILDIIEEDYDKCKMPFVNSFDRQNELANSMVKLPVNSEDTTNQESDQGGVRSNNSWWLMSINQHEILKKADVVQTCLGLIGTDWKKDATTAKKRVEHLTFVEFKDKSKAALKKEYLQIVDAWSIKIVSRGMKWDKMREIILIHLNQCISDEHNHESDNQEETRPTFVKVQVVLLPRDNKN